MGGFVSIDLDMHETVHIGMDSRTKRIRSIVVTPASIHDSQVLEDLLHGNETCARAEHVFGVMKWHLSAISQVDFI